MQVGFCRACSTRRLCPRQRLVYFSEEMYPTTSSALAGVRKLVQRPVCKGAARAGSLVELEESSCTGASGIGAGAGADDGSGALATSEEHLLTGHLGAVVCLAMYEDRLLFSGSTDCTIKVHLLCGHFFPDVWCHI